MRAVKLVSVWTAVARSWHRLLHHAYYEILSKIVEDTRLKSSGWNVHCSSITQLSRLFKHETQTVSVNDDWLIFRTNNVCPRLVAWSMIWWRGASASAAYKHWYQPNLSRICLKELWLSHFHTTLKAWKEWLSFPSQSCTYAIEVLWLCLAYLWLAFGLHGYSKYYSSGFVLQ